LASVYQALCKSPHLPDAVALPALASLHRHHRPALLEPLAPERSSELSSPALLALYRPAWLRKLLHRHGLHINARWVGRLPSPAPGCLLSPRAAPRTR
jgi:hypothetical protein